MQKGTVIRWWIWGCIAFVPGGILIPSSALALAAHLENVTRGPRYTFSGDGYSQMMVALIVVGGVFAVGGLSACLVAWIGALLNTRRLADTTWFNVVLWTGIAGLLALPLFGLGALISGGAMIAYLVAGPDGLTADARPTTPAKGTITKWAGRGFAVVGAGFILALLAANLTNAGRPLHGIVWPALAIESFGFTLAVAGLLAVCAAWCGALFNSHELSNKKWFTRLLWGGIAATVLMPVFGLGALIVAAVMIAYGHSAPDGLIVQQPNPPTPPTPPPTFAATS